MTTNNEVSIHSEKDVNKLIKLLREQKEEFLKETYNIIKRAEPLDCWEAYDEVSKEITEKHTNAQQQLIDVIIEGMKSEIEWAYNNIMPYHAIYSVESLQRQITLLGEAKKNL